MAKYFVFDVESIGLHGEGYAVGFVVVDTEGNELDSGRYACDPIVARGLHDDYKWVQENIKPIEITHDSPWLVRAAFWRKWLEWKESGAVMVADCQWPVEARFVAACVDDHPVQRAWSGPYPFHDVATALLMNGEDPLATRERLAREFPAHDPLADARQSSRIWVHAMANKAVKTIP